MAYTTIDDPSAYFQTVLYTGNEQARNITFDGNSDMQPDWVWAKIRTQTYSHRLFDSVRGTGKFLHSDGNDAEGTQNANVSAFNSNGFSLGNDNGINSDGDTHVAWCWKAGTSFTNDASSTGIGTIDSAGSISADAGFSIMTYTGTGSNATFAHGLGAVPKMAIFKDRSSTGYWMTYHQAVGNGANLVLNETNALSAASVWWNSTSPTSSVFSIGTSNNINVSGRNYVGYLFAEKQGYSKFGSYTGNGNADGTFIYTGFKPAWFMLKKTSATDPWLIYDNKRSPINQVQANLQANSGNAEATNTVYLDFLSNGVKFRNTDNDGNLSGGSYIYMTFAENPFVSSTGVPGTTR
jgi:hypothetical protein